MREGWDARTKTNTVFMKAVGTPPPACDSARGNQEMGNVQELKRSMKAPEEPPPDMLEAEQLRCLGHFVHKVMHNINGYLQNLFMLSEILAEGQERQDRFIRTRHPDSNGEWEALSVIQRRRLGLLAGQIAGLSDRMKDLALLGETEFPEKEIHLNLFLTKLADALRSDLLVKHGVALDLQLADSLPVVRMRGSHLIPVLIHIFYNTVTAMQDAPEKRLTVRSRYRKGFIRVDFTASSCGNGKAGPQREKPASLTAPELAGSLMNSPAVDEHPGLAPLPVQRLLSPCGLRIRLQESLDGTLTTLKIPVAKYRSAKQSSCMQHSPKDTLQHLPQT